MFKEKEKRGKSAGLKFPHRSCNAEEIATLLVSAHVNYDAQHECMNFNPSFKQHHDNFYCNKGDHKKHQYWLVGSRSPTAPPPLAHQLQSKICMIALTPFFFFFLLLPASHFRLWPDRMSAVFVQAVPPHARQAHI